MQCLGGVEGSRAVSLYLSRVLLPPQAIRCVFYHTLDAISRLVFCPLHPVASSKVLLCQCAVSDGGASAFARSQQQMGLSRLLAH